MRRDRDLSWNVLERTERHDYGVFRTRVHRAEHPETGRVRTFSVLEAPDWVNVIPLTPDDRVVLVRQFRHGTERVTYEIPGGAVDAGESHGQAAARELAEETGYRGSRIERIGTVEPNPALQTNRCSTWLALDVEPVARQELDAGEVIDVELRSLGAIGAMLRDGRIDHALVVAAFAHLLLVADGRLARPRSL